MTKKDDKIRQLNFDDEFLLDAAERRLQNGDYLGALTMLNKRNGMYEPSADAAAIAADVYEAMELWQRAADSWFVFLDTCNEADFSEGYEGLAVCFMNMGEDLQSTLYFHRVYGDEVEKMLKEKKKPKLRLVHSDDGKADENAVLERGIALLQMGELDQARELLGQVAPENEEFASATGLIAMCTLMLGNEEEAEKICETLLQTHPDNILALTTYCAVLQSRGDKEGAKNAALRLNRNPSRKIEDLFRIATALCETGLDEEAFWKLTELIKKIPYDETALYFYAVAAYRTDRMQEAIEALERLTTVYPRKAIAKYNLERMRRLADGGKKFKLNYFYRMPKEKYREVADFLLAASKAEGSEAEFIASLPELNEFFAIAMDEMEGRDEKIQLLAVKVALKTRSDGFLREVLLDPAANEIVKLSILHGLTERNEDDSFGTVFLNIYREFFTHRLELRGRRKKEFMSAFADVYSKFAFMNDGNEERIIVAAEDVFDTLNAAGAYELLSEREGIAAAVYREARLPHAEHKLERLCKLFGANKSVVEQILDFMM